jgi:hypothetical protein
LQNEVVEYYEEEAVKADIRSDTLWYLFLPLDGSVQGVIKRCRLSLLTNSALVYDSKCGGMGGRGVAGSQPISTAVHIT